MASFFECLLAFFATAGLFWLLWLLFGHLLCPAPGDYAGFTLLPVVGDADCLEQTVSQLLWLRGGRLLMFPIVLVDQGLSTLGRARVSRLMQREPRLLLCTPDTLANLWQKDG